ncbi:MAG TPA: hypothetical protein VMI54_13515 [Polyangiaceae bacterium]|nr:hypothetical protein [Polyangiaceae bacterium]
MRLFIGPIALVALTSGCIIDHTDGSGGYGGDTYYYSSTCSAGGTTSGGGTSGASNSNLGGEADGAGTPMPAPPPPACAELADQDACKLRADCQPIYAGTDCSCGPNCTCTDGDAGCTCEHFAYFACTALDPAEPPATR